MVNGIHLVHNLEYSRVQLIIFDYLKFDTMADASQVTKHISVILIVLVLLTKHGHIPVMCEFRVESPALGEFHADS